MKIHKDLEKYINENNSYLMFNTTEIDETRQDEFNQQRQEYGFDERETWDLDITTILWLYSHLKRFKEWNSHLNDFYGKNAHMYEVEVLNENKELETKNLSYGQIIDIILDYFDKFLADDDLLREDEYLYASQGMKLYGIILPSLWS